MMQYDDETKKWQVDRHIPVAVLMAIVAQTIGIIAWAINFEATTLQRLNVLEKQVDRMGGVNERIGRLEVLTTNNSEILKELRGYIINGKH